MYTKNIHPEVFFMSYADYQSSGIYMITNKVNNKIYIGSTRQTFNSRWSNHLYNLRNKRHGNTHLQRAFNKHGENAFEFSVLEEIDQKLLIENKDLQFEKEQIWLDILKPFGTKGYNIEKIAKAEKPQPVSMSEFSLSKNYLEAEKAHKKYKVEAKNSYIIFSPKGEKFETSNISYFCNVVKPEIFFDKEMSLRDIARKEHFGMLDGWTCYLKEEAPEEWIPYEEVRGMKKYRLISPNKELFETNNLPKFCRDNELNYRLITKCASPNQPNHTYKGWYCFEYTDDKYLEILEKNNYKLKIIPTIEELNYNYVLLAYQEKRQFTEYKLEKLTNLNLYLTDNNYLPPNLSGVKNKYKSYKKVYVFDRDAYLNSLEKDKLVEPIVRSQQWNQKRNVKCWKSFELTSPTGEKFITDHISNFAKEHDLRASNLRQVAKGQKSHHQGWLCKDIS